MNGYANLRNRIKLSGMLQRVIAESANTQASSGEVAQAASSSICSHPDVAFQAEYEVGEIIGQGANGVVRKCHRRRDGALFAVKVNEVEEEHLPYLRGIFVALNTLHHPCLVHHHELFIDEKRRTCHLVMDYIGHPSLSSFISSENPPAQSEIKTIIRQLLQVVGYLHEHKICHRDIKPDNILYDRSQGKIWLVDFGVSKLTLEGDIQKYMMTNIGTTHYKAPEMLEGGIYTESVDLWGVGVVFYELVEKRPPFFKEYLWDTIECIKNIQYEEGDAWGRMSKEARNLLKQLLASKDKRPTAEEALNAQWFVNRGTRLLRHANHSRSRSMETTANNGGNRRRLSSLLNWFDSIERSRRAQSNRMVPRPVGTGKDF